MIIYKITNKQDGKIYIGQTVATLTKRWGEHKRCTDSAYIHNALRAYGIEAFTCEQIDTATTVEELNIKEQTYIKAFNSLAPNGYNLKPGGDNHQHHPETRARMSISAKVRVELDGGKQFAKIAQLGREAQIGKDPWNKGLPATEEAKANQSEAHLGQPAWNKGLETSEETKLKQSLAKVGKHISPETEFKKGQVSVFKGKKHTPEALALISQNSGNARQVICIETGEKFGSVKAVAEKYDISKSHLLRLVNAGKTHTSLQLSFRFL